MFEVDGKSEHREGVRVMPVSHDCETAAAAAEAAAVADSVVADSVVTPKEFAAVIGEQVGLVLSALYPQADGAAPEAGLAGAGPAGGPAVPDVSAARSPVALTPVTADAWVAALARVSRQVENLLAQAVRVADDAGVEQRFRAGSQYRYLTGRHQLSARQAHAVAEAAKWTGLHRGKDAPFRGCEPETAAAALSGAVGGEHVATIFRELDKLPQAWVKRRPEVERALVKIARSSSPQVTAAQSREFIKRISRGKVTDRDRRRRRSLLLGRQHDDGMSYLSGWLTPTARAYFESMAAVFGQRGLNNVDDMDSPRGTCGGEMFAPQPQPQPQSQPQSQSEPGPQPQPGGQPPSGGQSQPAPGDGAGPVPSEAPETSPSPVPGRAPETGPSETPDAVPGAESGAGAGPVFERGVDRDEVAAAVFRDERTLGQRTHDAFAAACQYTALTGALGSTFKGLPAQLIVTAGIEQIEQAVGEAVTATGTRMSITEMLTCAERVHPMLVLFDHAGQIMHFGGTRRLASMEQRLALFARDLGCSRPGCHHGAFGTEVHHLIAWAREQVTDVGNLALACRADHRHVGESSTGLQTWMNPKTGRAVWANRAPDPNRPDPNRSDPNHPDPGGSDADHRGPVGSGAGSKSLPGEELADAVDAQIRASNARKAKRKGKKKKRRRRSKGGPRVGHHNEPS